MRAHEENRTPADRGPGAVPARPAAAPPPLLALQRAAGNAAVSRAVEADRHRHGAGCGHEAPTGAEQAAPEPAAQRRSSLHDALASPGRPLESRILQRAEHAYGMSFGHVRVHSGPEARATAEEFGARALTSGPDIVVGAQDVDDETMFHEIDHVRQQSLGEVAGTDDGSGTRVSDPGDRFERRSTDNGRRLAQGFDPDLGAP
ncbi:eCIS core domain-containing protein [Streptomyces tropicalis]|uniref:DUF4157 domain-containing protein n=1 Tax=Streptomyces tropicalis TaxID=3034234 RepID=A0ABT6AEA7_9ACTN|nr:DUF4157 domain-containing protein [Streptomyces tropicalis]MDF3302972.1 DUF4157 domain-containing protein [Streptomyces tropicalis]